MVAWGNALVSAKSIVRGGKLVPLFGAEFVSEMAPIAGEIVEQRIYVTRLCCDDHRLLVRHDLAPIVGRDHQYWFAFDSLDARTRAWDRLNADADWQARRRGASLKVSKLALYQYQAA